MRTQQRVAEGDLDECLLYENDARAKMAHQLEWLNAEEAELAAELQLENIPLIVARFIRRRIVLAPSFCLVCHRPLQLEMVASIKPFVCFSPLCQHQFMRVGLGGIFEAEIANAPSVVDLLISLAWSAASANQVKPWMDHGVGYEALDEVFDSSWMRVQCELDKDANGNVFGWVAQPTDNPDEYAIVCDPQVLPMIRAGIHSGDIFEVVDPSSIIPGDGEGSSDKAGAVLSARTFQGRDQNVSLGSVTVLAVRDDRIIVDMGVQIMSYQVGLRIKNLYPESFEAVRAQNHPGEERFVGLPFRVFRRIERNFLLQNEKEATIERAKMNGATRETTEQEGPPPNHALILEILAKLPSVVEMGRMVREKKLKSSLDAIDRLCYPLLAWIIGSNRAHLRELTFDKEKVHVGAASSTHKQFIMMIDSPEKEERFQKEKAQLSC